MEKFIPVSCPSLDGNELDYVKECIETNWISSKGKFVNKFEEEFSKYCGVEYGVSVMNGTVALHLALKALDIGEGDEVIVPDLTFAATINSVIYTGATPVIVDIDKYDWDINVNEIEKAISPRTKAIIPVHLYGQPCNMDEIIKLARKYNLFIVEDCAEAHGATYKGKKIGSFGDIACFSFYGNKIITTGEGGMCLTNNKEIYEKMLVLRDHGMSKEKRYWHDHVGFNYRMTNMQAAIGLAQLERIEKIIARRNEIANMYDYYLKDVSGVTLQTDVEERKKVVWMYSILIDDAKFGVSRDGLIEILQNKNIETRPFFYPLSSMKIYEKYSINRNEVASLISKQGLNLPTYSDIGENEIKKICQAIKNASKGM